MITDIPARRRYYCRACRHFFSLTSGTIFHNTHLPIWKWFLAVDLILRTDGGVPANELMKVLGGSYKTAWFVEHRIRAALCEASHCRHLEQRKPGLAPARTYDATLVGRYHQLGLKYLPAYEVERKWLARQRYNPNAFRNTVLALLSAEPVSLGELIAGDPPNRAGTQRYFDVTTPRRTARISAHHGFPSVATTGLHTASIPRSQ